MLSPELEREPDAVLLRQDSMRSIDERLSLFTVPLTWLDDDGVREQRVAHGSGVLVQLDGRKFVLSAAHVLRHAAGAKRCAIGIRRDRHRFVPEILGRFEDRYVPGPSPAFPAFVDYGFVELLPEVAATIEAAGCKAFAGPNSLVVGAPAEFEKAADWVVLAGFPDAVARHEDHASGYALVHTSTTLAGIPPAPPTRLSAARQRSIDLWVPENLEVNTVEGTPVGNRVPRFAGASGGGAWKSGVRPLSEKPWAPTQLKLLGIHVESSPTHVIDGVDTKFSRQVLVGHHLRLIADTTPEVRTEIFSRWPILEDECWAA